MQQLPPELLASFQRRLDRARIPQTQRPDYHRWVTLYLYFCRKYGYPPTAPTALGPFLIYLQTVPNLTLKRAKSPLDCL